MCEGAPKVGSASGARNLASPSPNLSHSTLLLAGCVQRASKDAREFRVPCECAPVTADAVSKALGLSLGRWRTRLHMFISDRGLLNGQISCNATRWGAPHRHC
jgi:hypothetical protein